VDLIEISERLEHEAVCAALEEAGNLALEILYSLLARCGAKGFDADPQRTDGSHDASFVARRLPCDLHRGLVDRLGLIVQAVGMISAPACT
jgi:hypothetical protein